MATATEATTVLSATDLTAAGAHHPYTQALLAASRSFGRRQ